MNQRPLRTTVVGSYPFPGWLEFACAHLDQFGEADRAELQQDAVLAAIHDQVVAGLDVITDGEQTRLDFNLSFYGFLDGIELEPAQARRFGPPLKLHSRFPVRPRGRSGAAGPERRHGTRADTAARGRWGADLLSAVAARGRRRTRQTKSN